MTPKIVLEDWSRYNAAVLARASMSVGLRRLWAATVLVALIAAVGAHVWWERRAAQLAAASAPANDSNIAASQQMAAVPSAPATGQPSQSFVFRPAAPPQPGPPSQPVPRPTAATPPPAVQPAPTAQATERPASPSLLPPATLAPQRERTRGGDTIVSNFTLFKSVDFRGGAVVTGWNFASSEDHTPADQFCYYAREHGSEQSRIEIEHRPGVRYPLPDALTGEWTPADRDEAASRCVWFDGPGAPVSASAGPQRATAARVPDPVPSPAPAKAAGQGAPRPVAPSLVPPAADVPEDPASPAPHTSSLSEAYGLPSIPGIDPRLVTSMLQGLRDRAAWETFFSSLPAGDAKAGAVFWTSERSLRNPRDCAAIASASDAYVQACNEARVLLTPADLRRKTDSAYRHGWNSYQSGDTAASPMSPSRPAPTPPEATAAAFVTELAKALSGTNDQMDAFYARAYEATVDFYGSRKSAAFVQKAKHDYAIRWPLRTYTIRENSLQVQCDSGNCTVSGLIDWDYASPARQAHSVGAANFTLVLTMNDGVPRISSEAGSVIQKDSI